MFEEDADNLSAALNQVISDLELKLSKIGLYMINADIGIVANDASSNQQISVDRNQQINVNIADIASNPENYSIYISSVFRVSDICWSDRVLNPERYEEDKKFRVIAETEFEITAESMADEILNWDDED